MIVEGSLKVDKFAEMGLAKSVAEAFCKEIGVSLNLMGFDNNLEKIKNTFEKWMDVI